MSGQAAVYSSNCLQKTPKELVSRGKTSCHFRLHLHTVGTRAAAWLHSRVSEDSSQNTESRMCSRAPARHRVSRLCGLGGFPQHTREHKGTVNIQLVDAV